MRIVFARVGPPVRIEDTAAARATKISGRPEPENSLNFESRGYYDRSRNHAYGPFHPRPGLLARARPLADRGGWRRSSLVAAVLLLYPAQLGAVPWPWRGLLPVLRLMAVFVLVASMLKPIAMRLATAEERGAVVVLVDRSRSMGVIDNSRTPAQLVALADALGKLQPNVRSDAATDSGRGARAPPHCCRRCARRAGRSRLCPSIRARYPDPAETRSRKSPPLHRQCPSVAGWTRPGALPEANELTRRLSRRSPIRPISRIARRMAGDRFSSRSTRP